MIAIGTFLLTKIMMFDSSDEQWRQLDEWDQRVAEVAA